MTPSLRPLLSLALALAAAVPAAAFFAPPPVDSSLAGAPSNSVPDNFIGPLAPGQCYASQCPGALAPAEAALDPKVLREQMKADGTYKTLTETPDGALIQLKDGSWTFDDNSMCTRPMSLEELVNNPSTPAAVRTAAKKELAGQGQAAEKKEQEKKDQAQICGSLNAGVECQREDKSPKEGRPVGIRSIAPSTPAAPAASAPSETADKGAEETDLGAVGDVIAHGGDGSESPGAGPAGANPERDRGAAGGPAAADRQREAAQVQNELTAEIAQSAKSGQLGISSTFVSNAEAMRRMNKAFTESKTALERDAAAKGSDKTTRGGSTQFFGGR